MIQLVMYLMEQLDQYPYIYILEHDQTNIWIELNIYKDNLNNLLRIYTNIFIYLGLDLVNIEYDQYNDLLTLTLE